ncbi:glutathione hydrolase 1 proenzyme-like [Glandiceps talaboti]
MSGKTDSTGCSRRVCHVAMVLVVGAVLIGVGVTLVLLLSPDDSEAGYVYDNAAVATDARECSEVGRNILKEGGSAVDAAISSMLCIGVINCNSAGIGGGFFMLIFDKESGKSLVVDAREKAPSLANQTMFENQPEKSKEGGLSIAVPGDIRGYWQAYQRYGKLPWKRLFQPAIDMASEGFVISQSLGDGIADGEEYVRSDPGLRETFVHEDGTLMKEGEICTMPRLADTLLEIADNGADIFYDGKIAETIVQDMAEELDGIISSEDLANYTAAVREPLEIDFEGYTVFAAPPPSSGAVVLNVLNVLDAFHLDKDDMADDEGSIHTYHRFAETCKFAFAKRTELGDVDYVVNIDEVLGLVLSEQFAEDVKQEINETWVTYENSTYYASFQGNAYYHQDDHGTTHLSVLAENGDAVSITSTINNNFGARFLSLRNGVIYNNQMDSFSTPGVINSDGIRPSEANFIVPGKRPMSSMSPIMITNSNGDVVMTIGASGSSKMITSTSLVTMETLLMENTLSSAIRKRRIHHKWLPNEIDYETEFNEKYIQGLTEYGHVLVKGSGYPGVVQAVYQHGGKVYAESDGRKGGYPAGY